ncbi:MAG: alpha/beta hydrolase [Gemmatimonadota bacterium]|nr:alpha/beta hydrolase [Gemmatimonadota bacterium]
MLSFWLHGWAADRHIFDRVIEHLDCGVRERAVALDLPGFGKEPALGESETYSGRILERLHSVKSGKEGVGLVGWSMGGMVTLEAAAALGEKTSAVVLISSCACFYRKTDNPDAWDTRVLRAMSRRLREAPEKVIESFSRGMFSPSAAPGLQERFLRLYQPATRYRSQGIEGLLKGLDYLSGADLRPMIERIKAPVLLIHAEDDPVIDFRLAGALASSLRNVHLVKLENGGHIPFWEAGQSFAIMIGDFLKKNSR